MKYTSTRRSFRLICEPEYVPLVEDLLHEEGYVFSLEKFSPLCRRLEYEPYPLGKSLAAFFGYIYIQDRASMLPPLALAPAVGEFVLDMCASPGGKSSFLAQLTGATGFVLANEPAKTRLATLRANLQATNQLQVGTSAYWGQDMPLPSRSCKAILLDAPCSGWGTVQKHPQVLKLWREGKIGRLIVLQRKLLTQAAKLLVPGGVLVYSTCTTNRQENEEQLRFAEEELGLKRDPLAPFPGFVFEERTDSAGVLNVDGDKSGAQGFFIARMRKGGACAAPVVEQDGMGTNSAGLLSQFKPKQRMGQQLMPQDLAGDCCDPSRLPPGEIIRYGEWIRFLPFLSSSILPANFVWQGMPLGRMTAGNFRPAPRLRCLLPNPGKGGVSLVLDDWREVVALLRGQSRQTGLVGRSAALWWRGLPLCSVRISQGRATAAF